MIKSERVDYQKNEGLLVSNLIQDPFKQFQMWYDFAEEKDHFYVNAMSLSTISDGYPESRIVLLKDFDERGFVFYTNYKSDKGNQIENSNKASLLFFWKEVERQVRIVGDLVKVPAEESDAYFQSRPFESQIGAWASPQSEKTTRTELEDEVALLKMKYENQMVPRPEHWGGYVLKPNKFEFWQGREGRLHDRFVYKNVNGEWTIDRIAP